MSDASNPKSGHTLAIIAGVLLIVLSLWGLLENGVSSEINQRMWRDFFDRPGGPMSFRFYLQPVMAIIAAVHDGINDARAGRTPYMQKLISRPGHMSETLGAVWSSSPRSSQSLRACHSELLSKTQKHPWFPFESQGCSHSRLAANGLTKFRAALF